MTDSVIKHYKKQLIYRQHDLPDQNEEKDGHHVKDIDNNKIYDFVDSEAKNDKSKKIRKKRKNRNCRGQFRHEGMELIKLGTNTSHSLCKTKEPYNARIEKEKPQPATTPTKENATNHKKAEKSKDTSEKSVIHTSFVDKTIILENAPPKSALFGHALPQMVPQRRNSREFNPPKPPTVPYTSPPRPDYRVPIHPTPYMPYPFPPQTLPYCPFPKIPSPPLPPPPPYSVPRSPVRPVPQRPPYQRIPYPYGNGYPPPIPARPLVHPPQEYVERKKRKHPPDDNPPVVAAIDLTVDQNHEKVEKQPQKHHKCHCECGKTYTSNTATQEVIITVAPDKVNSQVPTTYFRGKMVNGVFKLDNHIDSNSNDLKSKPTQPNGKAKISPPPPNNDKKEGKLPQLFLIKDLLAQGVRVEKPPSSREPAPKKKDQDPVPIRTEPSRVIVSTGHVKPLEDPPPRPPDTRRQSVEIDTISISSSSSESVRSPRPKPDPADKLIPRGKLFYYKTNCSFIRYFDHSQKKLFMDNLMADGSGCEVRRGDEPKEIIPLPKSVVFSDKDSLTVEEYVTEMTIAEKYIPKDFFLFYKFVTGYQICNNNLPVSFLTFLKIYNTNGLKVLLERYVNSFKQAS